MMIKPRFILSTWLDRVNGGYCTLWGARTPTLAGVHALHLQLGSIIRRVDFVSWITTCCECQKKSTYCFCCQRKCANSQAADISNSFPHHHLERQARVNRFCLVTVFRLLGTQNLVWRDLRLDMVPFSGQHAGGRRWKDWSEHCLYRG